MSTITSSYARDAMERVGDPRKQEQRDRVLRFLASRHQSPRLSLLSLPSRHWTFERQIDHHFSGRARFLGIEREIPVVHQSIPWMPGERPRWFRHEMADGKTIHGVRTDRATILNMDVASFMRTGRAETGPRTQRRIWADLYKRSTAVWLDFCGQIGSQIELALPAIGGHCDRAVQSVPVAVTVMKQREADAVTEKIFALGEGRGGYLAALLNSSHFRKFQTVDELEYVSGSGTPMLTVLGCLTIRADKAVRP